MKNPNTEKCWDDKFRNSKWTNPDYIMYRLKKYNFLMNVLPSNKKFSLLDIGCAFGYGLNLIKEHFSLASLHGLDFSRVAIDRAKEMYPEIEFEHEDIQSYEFSRKYDYIVLTRTLEHLTKPFSIIDKCLEYAESVIINIPPPDEDKEHINSFYLRNFHSYIFEELPSEKGLKLVIHGKKKGEATSLNRWVKDKLISTIKPYTLLDRPRLDNLYKVALYLEEEGIEGSFVECGTMNGGSAGLIASVGKNRQLWLLDSWDGLPEPTRYDVKQNGEKGSRGRVKGSKEKVEELFFDKLQSSRDKVHLIEGWFNDTIPSHIDKIGKIALLHLDCDYYESVKLCLESLYDSVVENGVIVIDDYMDWQGCKKATDEFIDKVSLEVRVMSTGRVVDIQKRSG